ncbi:MAG: OmpA family protein [Pseudomonadota bacterium]
MNKRLHLAAIIGSFLLASGIALANDTADNIARQLMPDLSAFEQAAERARQSAGSSQPSGQSRSWQPADPQRTRGYHSEVPRLNNRAPQQMQKTEQRVVSPQPVVKTSKSFAEVTFRSGSAQLTEEGKAVLLRDIVPALTKVDQTVRERTRNWSSPKRAIFNIVGHTDAAGSHEYNYDLSMRRARTVSEFIERYTGMVPVPYHGVGETQLVDVVNVTAQANRRVEIEVTVTDDTTVTSR